jgi:hypothetical protein
MTTDSFGQSEMTESCCVVVALLSCSHFCISPLVLFSILSRNGTLRNELHVGNSSLLLLTMSNHGSSIHLSPSHGGGAKDSNGALNGMNNGGQTLAYVTDSGIGLVKMNRIHSSVDQYCAWDESDSMGIRSGHDVSAIAFDGVRANILDATGLRQPCPPTGCHCHAMSSSRLHFAQSIPAATGAVTASKGSIHPQYSLLPMRGFLAVSNNAVGALAIYNTSGIAELSAAHTHEDESGLEFMLERQIPVTSGSGKRVQLERLVGDRIELLFAGEVSDCVHFGCHDSDISPILLQVFESFLPHPQHAGGPFTWSWSFLTQSRLPLFGAAVVSIFAWKWWNKRKADRDRAGLVEVEDEDGMAEFEQKGRNGRRGQGYADAALQRALGPRASAALEADGAFDSESFMSDFLSWQKEQKSPAGASSKSTTARSAAYTPDLASERARVLVGSNRSSNIASGPLSSRLASREQERLAMRRKLATLDPNSAVAVEGLGVGGAELVEAEYSSSKHRSEPSVNVRERFDDLAVPPSSLRLRGMGVDEFADLTNEDGSSEDEYSLDTDAPPSLDSLTEGSDEQSPSHTKGVSTLRSRRQPPQRGAAAAVLWKDANEPEDEMGDEREFDESASSDFAPLTYPIDALDENDPLFSAEDVNEHLLARFGTASNRAAEGHTNYPSGNVVDDLPALHARGV